MIKKSKESLQELEILKRFRNVFGLAYRGYMDTTQNGDLKVDYK